MIGIIGSGNVGANSAFFLAEKGVDHVVLYDIQEGTAQGKALDMMEAAPIRGYRTNLKGVSDPAEALACDIVIITAGAVRKPGMKRDELFIQNRRIIEDYASRISNPSTKVIIVSEPVDMLTTVFARSSSLPLHQVMGLGCILDATRLRYLIARELKVAMENVAAQVIGRHTDDMIPLKAYCCVSGISLDTFLAPDRIATLFEETKNSGHLIVDLAERMSAYYGPSAVAAELAEAIILDTGRVMSISHVLTGQLGIKDIALSFPAVIGKNGITRTLEPVLNDEEASILKKSADLIAYTIKEAEK